MKIKEKISPAILIAVAVYFLYAMAASFMPLVSNFGFEFNLFLATLAGFFSAIVAVDILFKYCPQGSDSSRIESVFDKGIYTIAFRIILFLLGLIFLAAIINIIFSMIFQTTCNWGIGIGWFVTLAPVTAVYSSVLGIIVGTLIKKRRRAMVVAGLLVLSGIIFSLYQMAAGPHCFSYNPFFGYFPGPIYDRVINISPQFLLYRLANIATALFFLSLLSIVIKVILGRREKTNQKFSGGEIFITAVLFVSLLVFAGFKADLGLKSSQKIIRKELSAVKQTDHFNIYYPPDGAIANQIEFIAAEHEFRYHQITSELKIEYPEKINSYIYLSDKQKKILQGAGSTMYADVSNSSIHMSDRSFPHKVLKHEMTHVITSVWGIPYFGWSINVGLTEGIAVCQEGYRRDGTIHGWAAAMNKLDRLPDVAKILNPWGFWSKTGSRSYLTTGSFSLWLIQTKGLEKFQKAYKWGGFESAYGVDIKTLRDQWLDFLDTVEVSEVLMTQARHKFTRRSIFEQDCVREIERLLALGNMNIKHKKYHSGMTYYLKAAEYAPNNPKVSIGLFDAYFGAKYYDKAYQVVVDLIENQGGLETLNSDYSGPFSPEPVIAALTEMARADWMFGRNLKAKEEFLAILDSNYSEEYRRFALVALAALEDEKIESYVRAFMASDVPLSSRVYYLTRAVQLYPKKVVPRYLLARQLYSDREYFSATSHMLEVLKAENLDTSLRSEGLFVLAKSLFFQKRFDESIVLFQILAKEPLTKGRELDIEDWIARVEFAKSYF